MTLEKTIHACFQQFHQPQKLLTSQLAAADPVLDCLLDDDLSERIADAIIALLLWALEQLGEQSSSHAKVSQDVLQKRYVEQMSATQYADLMLITDVAGQARRKAAIKRITKIIEQELVEPAALEKRRQQLVRLRYERLSVETLHLLHLLAISNRPRSTRLIDEMLPFTVEPHLATLRAENLIMPGDSGSGTWQLHRQITLFVRVWIDPVEKRSLNLSLAQQDEAAGHFIDALYHLIAAQKWEQVVTLILQTQQTIPFLTLQHLIKQIPGGAVPAEQAAELALLYGQVSIHVDDLNTAITACERALQAQNRDIRAKAYLELTRIYTQNNTNKAFFYVEAGKRIAQTSDSAASQHTYALLLIQEGWLNIVQTQQFDQAKTLLDRAEAILQSDDDSWHLVHYAWHNVLATWYSNQAQFEDATEHQWQAWQFAQRANDTQRAMKSTYNLGTNYARMGDYEQAFRYYEESLRLAQLLNNSREIAVNQKGLGHCAYGRRDYAAAINHYTTAYLYFKKNNDQFWQAATAYDLAEAHIAAVAMEEAISYLDECERIATDMGIEPMIIRCRELRDKHPELRHDLSTHERLILQYVKDHGRISRNQCIEITNLKRRQSSAILATMVDDRLLLKHGDGRSTYYTLLDSEFLGNKHPELRHDLSTHERLILRYVHDNGRINRQQCTEITTLKQRQSSVILTTMVEEGLLAKHGGSRSTYYMLPCIDDGGHLTNVGYEATTSSKRSVS